MTHVKICGITTYADARHAVDCGADLLGFNFYEPSPRYISPAEAANIIDRLGTPARAVGVFVNEGVDRVHDIAITANIGAIQLHGDETARDVEHIRDSSRFDVIKAFRLGDGFDASVIALYPEIAVLIDAFAPGVYGGSGNLADWETARQIVESGRKVYLAGGLTAENVADAVRSVRPFAVDAASGVETSPGKKDPRKIEAFIAAVRSADIEF